MKLVEVTDERGAVCEHAWFLAAEAIHRQLRPHLSVDYSGTLERIFRGGARMAVVVSESTVSALVVWRLIENTAIGRYLYVDDLVVDAACRSQGIGSELLQWLEQRARSSHCGSLVLDSGVERGAAHRFYFREGLSIVCFNFEKRLGEAPGP